MKRLWLLLLPAFAFAAPPYDVTVDFSPPVSGGTVDGYNFYLDDCLSTGPVGAPFGVVIPGQKFVAAITADGVYEGCVRAFNIAGEQPDPGQVAPINLLLPGVITQLTITVTKT